MVNTDTVELLQECDAGAKMAVTSIDEVLEEVDNLELKRILQESKNQHERLGNELHAILKEHKVEGKEPSLMAKGMSWMKTNVKMGMNDSDKTVADLIVDGCDMGIKSLNKYLNQYSLADDTSKDICRRLIAIEEELCKELQRYL